MKNDGLALKHASVALKNDKNLVSIAVGANGMALEFASARLQEDRAVVLQAIQRSGDAIQFSAPRLRSDRELILAAVSEKGAALQFAPAYFGDREIMLAAFRRELKDDPSWTLRDMRPQTLFTFSSDHTLDRASARLKKDRSFIEEAVRINGVALSIAEPALREDRNLVLAALQTCGEALQYAAAALKDDAELVRAAIDQDARALRFASPRLQRDPELVARAIEKDVRTILDLPPEVSANIPLLAACAERNILLLDQLPAEAKTALSARFPALAKKRAALAVELEAAGIQKLDRFPDERILRRVLADRTPSANDPRPLAVLAYARADETGALRFTQIDQLQKNYRVAYYEASTDSELFAALERATEGKKADLLVLAGHGTRGDLALGGVDAAMHQRGPEELYLDLGDHQKLSALNLGARITTGGHIVLRSCSTGEGEEDHPNLARMLSDLAPNANLWAPREPINNQMIFDAAGFFQDPGFSGHQSVVFHRAPR